jgi:YidC/Oxa1 family membrane protein insertase
MLNFFYTLFIFPIEQVIELCYVFSIRILRSPGLSIIALSMVVSTLVLPFYFMVEKQQKAEREKQSRMKRMKDNINVVFKGDKRFMMLSTLYRQHNYHPLYALRNSFDLFIQIPFFIAAYHFFSNLEMLNGQAFKFINDLGVPDSLLKGINILPILMTLINIISGAIYTKGLALRDKIQVFGIAAVFLLLLYNSPSALVLYWTCNNLYNLAKNILQKTKNAQKIVYTLVLFIAGNMVLYLLFFHEGSVKKRLFVVTLIVMVLLLSVWKRIWLFLKQKIGTPPPSIRTFIFQ